VVIRGGVRALRLQFCKRDSWGFLLFRRMSFQLAARMERPLAGSSPLTPSNLEVKSSLSLPYERKLKLESLIFGERDHGLKLEVANAVGLLRRQPANCLKSNLHMRCRGQYDSSSDLVVLEIPEPADIEIHFPERGRRLLGRSELAPKEGRVSP